MSGGLTIDATSSDRVSYLRLSGSIDGSLDAAEIEAAATTPIVVLNLEDVSSVDEAGLKAWRKAMASVGKAAERLVLMACSPQVVERMNAQPEAVAPAAVASVRVDLHCTQCDRTSVVTIDVDMPVTDDTLEFACAQCDNAMEPDTEREVYFAFTEKVPLSPLGEEIQVVVMAAERPRGPPSIEPGSDEANEIDEAAEAIAAAEHAERARQKAEMEAAVAAAAEREAEKQERKKNKKSKVGKNAQAKPTAAASERSQPAPEPVAEPKPEPKPESKREPKPEPEPAAEPEPVAAPTSRPGDATLAAAPPGIDATDEPVDNEDDYDRIDPADDLEPAPPRRDDDQTDPALRVVPVQSSRSFEKTKPGIPLPSAGSRLRHLFGGLGSSTPMLIAGASVGVSLGLLMMILLSGPSGVPPEELLSFHEHLEQGRYEEAEKLLALHLEALPPKLAELADEAIAVERGAAADDLLAAAEAALEKKDFVAALSASEAGLAIAAADVELLYIAAEALRLMKRALESAEYYGKFVAAQEEDERYDDALYWQAEGLLAAGKLDEAKALYGTIVTLDGSNFKTSATRRLSELGATAATP